MNSDTPSCQPRSREYSDGVGWTLCQVEWYAMSFLARARITSSRPRSSSTLAFSPTILNVAWTPRGGEHLGQPLGGIVRLGQDEVLRVEPEGDVDGRALRSGRTSRRDRQPGQQRNDPKPVRCFHVLSPRSVCLIYRGPDRKKSSARQIRQEGRGCMTVLAVPSVRKCSDEFEGCVYRFEGTSGKGREGNEGTIGRLPV